MSSSRPLLTEAAEVVSLFLTATTDSDFEMTADLALSGFCARHGSDNAAAALAAFATLTLHVAAQAGGQPPHALLTEVRRRIDGDDPPPALMRA
jgi:hypothetical protein